VIEYNLRDAAAAPVKISVSDAAGHVVRELEGSAAKGFNRVEWDLRYAPPVDSAGLIPASPRGARGAAAGRGEGGGQQAATPVGFPERGGGGFRGGPPVGPLVMPGRYAVAIAVPGVAKPLTGSIVVSADPLATMSSADRAARQAILMRIYDWTRALGNARVAARQLVQERDALQSDLGPTRADSLGARITRLAASVDQAFASVNGHRSAIEGWSGMPTLDQRTSLGYAVDDGRKAIADLNGLVAGIASAYRAAGKTWTGVVKPVAPPRGM
jgi:hypothetical protein